MKVSTIVLAAVMGMSLAAPALAVHGPFSAPDGATPGNTTPDNRPQPAGREAGENGKIASEADKGNPNEDGTNDVIDDGEGGGLFPGQSGSFPGGR